MVDVVIASSDEDEALVHPIVEQLRSLGLDVWRSAGARDSQGVSVEDIGERQVAKSGAVLVCWTENSALSKQVLAEAGEGLWQEKLVACRLSSSCVLPPPFDSIRASNLHDWEGRANHPGWKEIISFISEKLRRPGLSELLQACLSGDESALYSFARRFPDEPQAREIWAVYEARYREECATALRDARRCFEQRAASHKQKIEALLKSFANDFQVWLERERRGETSPNPV